MSFGSLLPLGLLVARAEPARARVQERVCRDHALPWGACLWQRVFGSGHDPAGGGLAAARAACRGRERDASKSRIRRGTGRAGVRRDPLNAASVRECEARARVVGIRPDLRVSARRGGCVGRKTILGVVGTEETFPGGALPFLCDVIFQTHRFEMACPGGRAVTC